MTEGIQDFPESGQLWYTDGGLLGSQPLGRVIAAGRSLHGSEPGALGLNLLINPRSEETDTSTWSDPEAEPSFQEAASRALGILSEQSLFDDLRRIEKDNSRIEWANRLADDLAGVLDDGATEALREFLERVEGERDEMRADEPKRERSNLDTDDLRALLHRALCEIGGLVGKDTVAIDVISPLLLDEGDGDTGSLLAGEFMGDFGGFLSHELRVSDFSLGFESAIAWIDEGLRRCELSDEVVDRTVERVQGSRLYDLAEVRSGGTEIGGPVAARPPPAGATGRARGSSAGFGSTGPALPDPRQRRQARGPDERSRLIQLASRGIEHQLQGGARMTIESLGRAVQSRIYRDGTFGTSTKVPVHPERLERAARRAMSANAWAYIAGSAGIETTAAANRAAFAGWEIVPRMLRQVEERDLGIELFGRRQRTPFLFSPIGVLEMLHGEADLVVARAARRLEVPMIISTQGSRSMEQISAEMGDAERWYQLYWSNNDELVASMVSRAEACGATAIAVTLDTHILGWRPQDLDLGFLPFARGQGIAQYTSDPVFLDLVARRAEQPSTQDLPRPTLTALRSLASVTSRYPGGSFLSKLRSPLPRAAVETFLDVFSRSSLTWENLKFLREHTSLPILLKGIQHVDDAKQALEYGMDGVYVSNHGGRQVDGAIGSLDALPGIVEAVDGRVPVVFDSGIRCGADAFKALALGATAIAIGRPWAYGLAIAGEQGAVEVMSNLIAELDITMGLAGATTVAELTPDLLRPAPA